jgi:glycosyltransferase involved in cell wall biosynthesis
MDTMKNLGNRIAKNFLKIASFHWKPYSRLILYGDEAGWVLDWEMRELKKITRQLGIQLASPIWKHAATPQSIFFSNHFVLLNDEWMRLLPSRIGFSYFHGLPNTGDKLFDAFYESLCKHHEQIMRIQVSHTQMRDVTLKTGIDSTKVFQIPIGINLDFFPFQTPEQKTKMRDRLGISRSAFVIGSFQKDGVGWGDGLDPKSIKGPDVFLSTIKLLKKDIPEMYVLLSGPARGFVKKGLEELQIPYKHVYLKSYPDIARLFWALDLYLVASRQEGGPKAVLESMASGVPLVTTRVGQAMDLVKHGENAWMAEVEDANGLSSNIMQVYNLDYDRLLPILRKARSTAEANSYQAQIPLWKSFMDGFVEHK